MARFAYRLERVLDIARLREEALKSVLMARVQEARAAADREHARREQLTSAEREVSRLVAPGPLNAFEAMLGLTEIEHRKRGVADAHAEWQVRKAAELEASRAYLAARHRREAFEKLRERKLIEWQREEAREELKLIDEAASRRHQREGKT